MAPATWGLPAHAASVGGASGGGAAAAADSGGAGAAGAGAAAGEGAVSEVSFVGKLPVRLASGRLDDCSWTLGLWSATGAAGTAAGTTAADGAAIADVGISSDEDDGDGSAAV
eukprot:1160338-Pelagomonas_calceolata.AAC.2